MKKCGSNLSNVLAARHYTLPKRAFRALQDDEPAMMGVLIDSELIDDTIEGIRNVSLDQHGLDRINVTDNTHKLDLG
ncbi:hypothetical protein Tco_0246632 [Tanacetum coccineum]